MPKMKSKRALRKRVKLTGRGRLRRYHAYKRHILTKKSAKRKRRLRKPALVAHADERRFKRLLLLA
jgi:large subunit ribosomal protein L35